MKAKIIISVILFIIAASFVFKNSANEFGNNINLPLTTNGGNEFFIMAFHSGIDTHYTYYPQLNVNGWHKYTAPKGWGWPQVQNDDYDVASSVYGPSLSAKIDSNRAKGLSSVMDRPKTQYLMYGQRSDYQCENVPTNNAYWFYAYDYSASGNTIYDTIDNSVFGNGTKVKYCQTNPTNLGSNAGYIVKNLRANREQAEKLGDAWWKTDSEQSWFIKPRIRIDSIVIGINENTKVCTIIISDWDGNTVDSVDILAKNFQDGNFHYNGSYIEEFSFPNNQNKLKIDSGYLCPGPAKNFWDWGVSIKTDFRFYWYGLCDMWIDYVRVENTTAHELFKTNNVWDVQLQEETEFALQDYASNQFPDNFYVDEFNFNNIPCISYVNKKIQEYSQNKLSVMAAFNYPMFKNQMNPSVQSEMTAAEIKRYLIDSAQIKYLLNFSYPLEGWKNTGPPSGHSGYQSSGQTVWETYHPSTLSSEDYNPLNGILSYKTTVSDYEIKLQERLDEGRGAADQFTKMLKLSNEISMLAPDLTLMHISQSHMWWAPGHK